MHAPIALFVYKRVDTLKSCIHSLLQNSECQGTTLFIYSDAAANSNDIAKVRAVRNYIHTISGFKTIFIVEAQTNKGLADSIITGVTDVLSKYGKVVVLEDDLLVSNTFLAFMNSALDFYANESKVLSISGFTLPVRPPYLYPYDIYFTNRAFSWGWATWKDRWRSIDWAVSNYSSFVRDNIAQRSFNAMGTDLSSMLHKQMKGQINSWAIRLCYHQFKYKMFSVFPIHSKVINNGFNADATHSGLNIKRYKTIIEEESRTGFKFSDQIELNQVIIRQFTSHFSLKTRAFYKLIDYLNKL